MTLTKTWSKYNNPFNFIKKDKVDVNDISIFLLEKNEDEYFNEKLNLTHHKHGKALIIQDYPRNWFYGAPFTPEFECEDEELWSLTKPIIDKLEKDCNGKAAKIFYFLLPAGTNIYIHMDMGQYFSAVHRHQIPIITNPQCESWVDGETVNMKAGEVWEINNVKRHAVDNNGTTSRINLIVDIMPMWAIKAKKDTIMNEIKKNTLAPGIVSYYNVGENICNMIPEWEQNIRDGFLEWMPAKVGRNKKIRPDYRDVNTLSVSGDPDNLIMNKIIEQLDNAYKLYIEDYCKMYYMSTDGSDAYTILKYEKGHHYKEHYDYGPGEMSKRNISFIHYLNEDYQGGELNFIHFNLKIKPEKGQLIIFPSNFPYLHQIEPVLNGERWAITKFLY